MGVWFLNHLPGLNCQIKIHSNGYKTHWYIIRIKVMYYSHKSPPFQRRESRRNWPQQTINLIQTESRSTTRWWFSYGKSIWETSHCEQFDQDKSFWRVKLARSNTPPYKNFLLPPSQCLAIHQHGLLMCSLVVVLIHWCYNASEYLSKWLSMSLTSV